MLLKIDELHSRFTSGEEFSVNLAFNSEEINQEIYSLLLKIMSFLDQLFLTEVVYTILKEILVNASKANAKREFFKRNNYDINNPAHYKLGMEKFRAGVTEKWDKQEEFLINSGYFINFRGKNDEGFLVFTVENNSSILPEEMKRIQARIDASKKYNDLSDAFLDMSDTEESAGLGIILTQLLLKNTGIGQQNFKIDSDGTKTIVSLRIPDQLVPLNITNKFKEKILDEVQGLPPLPQSLTRIIEMCNNKDSDMNQIAHEIEKNPALSADLLKLSNSAGFAVRNKVSSIHAAVKVVGLKNIKNMLYVSGVRKIMDGKYTKLQEVWDHSNKCSFVARYLAMENGRAKYADIGSVGGLLHDLGKLVLLSIDKSVFSKMSEYKDRDMSSSTVIEEFSIGISHSTLGAILAKKWSFPADVTAAIEFHHRPFMAPPEHREVAELIYLANMITDVIHFKGNFFAIERSILKSYSLDKKEDFEKFLHKIETLYAAQNDLNSA